MMFLRKQPEHLSLKYGGFPLQNLPYSIVRCSGWFCRASRGIEWEITGSIPWEASPGVFLEISRCIPYDALAEPA